MAAQNRQWILLDEIISSYMDEAELSNHKYFKIWQLAFRFLTDIGMDAFNIVKAIRIPVNANFTATLPADYINYCKVGVLNEQGEIITMGVNNKLTTAFDMSPNRLEQTQDATIPTQINLQGVWWWNFWNGQAYSPVYGLPSGSPFIGSFKIDEANGVIILSENFPYGYVMLEYTSAPKVSDDYAIPVQFKEAAIAYLRWMDKIGVPIKSHMDNSNIAMRRHDYFNELRKAKAKYDPVRIPDLYEWNLLNQRLTVKA